MASEVGYSAKHQTDHLENTRSTKGRTIMENRVDRKTADPGEPPYLQTTEVGQEDALKTISTYTPPANNIYIGFAFEFNYHLLAQRPAQKVYICDINPRMLDVFRWIATNIIETPERKVFLEMFEKELSSKPEHYLRFPPTTAEAVEHMTTKEYSWLYQDPTYHAIRNMYREGKIIHLSLDLATDSETFGAIALEAERNGQVFDIIYLSNIPEWLERTSGGLDKMKGNLTRLITPNTLIVDAKRNHVHEGITEPVLRVNQRDFPKFIPSPTKRRTPQNTTTCKTSGLSRDLFT